MTAYYNEFDPKAAAWLRELISAGEIAHGEVDERSIQDVTPNDLKGFTQHHFFAGVGVWSYALRRAGWPDDKQVWTGSCPCQPFSAAGKGDGFDDERHLWPDWFHLITQCRPADIFGEQVATKDGLAWLDLIQADLEGTDYTNAAVDLCAAGFGAPHWRQRLYFYANRMGDTYGEGLQGHGRPLEINGSQGRENTQRHSSPPRTLGGLADTSGTGLEIRAIKACCPEGEQRPERLHTTDRLADTTRVGFDQGRQCVPATERHGVAGDGGLLAGQSVPGPTNGFWRDADWLYCQDGKWRPVEPETFPLAHGVAGRVGLLRGAGNAIVAPVAQGFIEAVMEATL